MKFNKALQNVLEELDQDVKDAWGDIVPHLDPPIYYVYFCIFSRGLADITNEITIKAIDIEKALNKVYDMAIEDMEEDFRLNNLKPNKYNYEWFEMRPISDSVGIVITGEETGAVISNRKLNIDEIEEILYNEQ